MLILFFGRKKATIAENIEKRDATQYGSQQEMQVEDATDNYRLGYPHHPGIHLSPPVYY